MAEAFNLRGFGRKRGELRQRIREILGYFQQTEAFNVQFMDDNTNQISINVKRLGLSRHTNWLKAQKYLPEKSTT